MTTLFLEWGGDFEIMCRTSIETATGWDEIRQRILRRIITNPSQQIPDGTYTPADYIFDQKYGIGAGKMIGEPFNDNFVAQLKRRIQFGVLLDSAVDTSVPPSIKLIRPNINSIWCVIGVSLAAGNVGHVYLEIKSSGW